MLFPARLLLSEKVIANPIAKHHCICYNPSSPLNAKQGGILLLEAVIFDLDDTLLHDNRTISDETVRVLQTLASHGVRILPASGRSPESMEQYVRRLGCCEAYIACNGAEVWKTSGECLMKINLPLAVAEEVIQFGNEYDVYMQTYDFGTFHYNRESHFAQEYAVSTSLRGILTPDLITFLQGHPTCKILLMGDPELISRMRADGSARFSDRASITTSKPTFLEVNPLHTSKGLALAFCADHFNFHLDQTIAFGDSLNDLSMIQAAGTGVAVGNAWDEVKACADDVCLSNEEDGIAHYLTDHFPCYF